MSVTYVAVGAYIDNWATQDQKWLALQWLRYWLNTHNTYCSFCGVAQTTDKYCDSCVQDIINYLLWEDSSRQEQLAECLHMAVCDENYNVGRGLY